ncbi:MAG: 16S rRNA (adenine(1518)-N(6)/adenine(1519)-N(6))-dimethyltransferase RsmA [Caldilineaceae bacterium]
MTTALDIIRRYQLNPKRSLAQNFLTDERYLTRIAAVAELTKADTVLEIGPGLGSLTTLLAQQAGQVIAVELDDRLIEMLRAQFILQPHVQIVHGDILELDLATLLQGTAQGENLQDEEPAPAPSAYKVVANLPYYITSAVIRHLLEAPLPPELTVVMVQKEVAERICAQPGDLSILAVSVQFYAQPTLMHHIPATAFYPRPKVDSAVLRLERLPTPAVPDVAPDRFFQVVRAGFSQKRKQLVNTVSGGLHLSKPEAAAALEAANIDPKRRAETLALAEWGALCRALDAS